VIVGIADAAVFFTYLMINGFLEGGASGVDIYMIIFQVRAQRVQFLCLFLRWLSLHSMLVCLTD